MREYYIIDSTHNRFSIDKIRTCEVAAKLRLYHGPVYTNEDIEKMWTYDSICPCLDKIRKNVRNKHIKWYIYSHTDELVTDPSWNQDFLRGMLQCGRILKHKRDFYSFVWHGNFDLVKAINTSPYAGHLHPQIPKTRTRYVWSRVPCLCFNFNPHSIDILAGVLSTGIVVTYKGMVLARYNPKVGKITRELGIPIEYENQRYTFISPFWPVICQKHMPKFFQDKWKLIPHAHKAKEYSSILWKIYNNKDPVAGEMPYLLSRRSIFYKYGSMKALRVLWIKNNMVELDSRFKKVVQEWHGKIV